MRYRISFTFSSNVYITYIIISNVVTARSRSASEKIFFEPKTEPERSKNFEKKEKSHDAAYNVHFVVANKASTNFKFLNADTSRSEFEIIKVTIIIVTT